MTLQVPRILLIGPHPPPYGGPGVHMLYLRRRCEHRGARCDILNLGVNRRYEVPGALPVRSGADFLHKLVYHVRRRYHIHHFFNVEGPKAIVLAATAAVAAVALGGSYSIGFIGGPHQRYLNRTRSPWNFLFRVPLSLASLVICNNALVREALVALRVDERKIHALECFHPQQVSDVGDLPSSLEAFMGRHRPAIASVIHPRYETDDPHHEIRLLAEAIAGLRTSYPEVGCLVVGGHDGVPQCRAVVDAAGLSRHFCFAGELSHRVCLAAMKRSSVFVRAYLKDGSSSSVREALTLGVHTVASRNPQHPRGVVEFQPGSGPDLTRALRQVLQRPGGEWTDVGSGDRGMVGDVDREFELLLAAGARRVTQPLSAATPT